MTKEEKTYKNLLNNKGWKDARDYRIKNNLNVSLFKEMAAWLNDNSTLDFTLFALETLYKSRLPKKKSIGGFIYNEFIKPYQEGNFTQFQNNFNNFCKDYNNSFPIPSQKNLKTFILGKLP